MRETKLNYEFGPFRLSVDERTLWRNETVVRLTPKVFDILLVLVENGSHILTKKELMSLVWPDTSVEEGNLSRNISTLRKALGDRSTRCQYIETIPWRGYRFVASVSEARDPSTDQTGSIAVLPFINESPDSDMEYLADGITDNLIDNLSRIENLKVISHRSVFHYKTRGSRTRLDARAIGRELDVHVVCTGRMIHRGDSLLISVELVDARDNSHIWGARYNQKNPKISSVPATISRDIAERLQLRLSAAEKRRLIKKLHQQARSISALSQRSLLPEQTLA